MGQGGIMLIAWSGGCDSTLVLYRELLNKYPVQEKQDVKCKCRCQCHKKVDNPDKHNHGICTISYNHDQLGTISDIQKERRKIIKEKLKKMGYEFNSVEINYSQDGARNIIQDGLCQPHLWIINSLQYMQDGEELCLGYIRHDDFFGYQADFEYIWHYTIKVLGKPQCKVKYPLEYINKYEVIQELKKNGLYKYCWWCGTPDKNKSHKPCGKCTPCIHHIMALKEIEYRKYIEPKLDKEFKKVSVDKDLIKVKKVSVDKDPVEVKRLESSS